MIDLNKVADKLTCAVRFGDLTKAHAQLLMDDVIQVAKHEGQASHRCGCPAHVARVFDGESVISCAGCRQVVCELK